MDEHHEHTSKMSKTLFALCCTLLGALACQSPSELDPIAPSESLVALSRIEFGESRRVQAEWEARLRSASLQEYPELERQMIWVLDYPPSTFAAEQFACRVLRLVGTERAVPHLAALLDDEPLAHPARYALGGIDSKAADGALRGALFRLDGELRRGVIDTLAARGERGAVPPLSDLLRLELDLATRRSIFEALGRLGGDSADAVLIGAKVPEPLRTVWLDARLRCADAALAEGNEDEALAIYREVAAPGNPIETRVAAALGIVKANPDGAVPVVGALFLAGEPELARAAARCLVELEPDADLTQLLARVDGFGDEPRILALGALAERGTRAAVPNALAALDSKNEGVRVAGIAALGRIGEAEHVERLAPFTWGEGAEAAAARRALEDSSAPGTNAAILAFLGKTDHDTIRAELIGCLVARRAKGAVPVLLRLAETGGERARAASLAGLGALGTDADLPAALALLAELERPADREALEGALLAICRRALEPARAIGVLVTASSTLPGAARVSVLNVLGELPSEQTLAPLVRAATGERIDERLAAVTALSRWPDAAPAEVLQAVSKQDGDERVRLAALEGYLRLFLATPGRSSAETLDLYRQAFTNARGAEAKRVVVQCAGRSGELWAVGFVEGLRGDAEVGDLAAESWATLCSALARKVPHRALRARVTLEFPPAEKYAGEGAATLTDGKWGSSEYGDGRWIGFHEHDVVATIDLGEVTEVRDVRAGFMRSQNSWIFPPKRVEVSLSDDGGAFREVAGLDVPEPVRDEGTTASDAAVHLDGARARYVRVRLVHPSILPKWHPGSGEPAWLFVDEIAVNSRYEQ